MSKKDSLKELVNILVNSICHKIGSIVNNKADYAKKYEREAENFLNDAKEIAIGENWNQYDKIEIREELKKKVKAELERRIFLDNKKFSLMDEETEKALKELNLA